MSTAQNILPTAEKTPDVSLAEENTSTDPVTEKKVEVSNDNHEGISEKPVNASAKSEVNTGPETATRQEPLNPASSIPTPSTSNNINPSAILETTIDNLANISSKINPITQKLGKGFDQVRQV